MRNFDSFLSRSLFTCLAFFSLITVFFLYSPGFKGEFILDDFANLPPLFDAIRTNGFWYGVFSGTSGPLGRPLTLLTFAVQHESWPNPYCFKVVGLVVHLLNTTLVFFLICLLSPYLPTKLRPNYYNYLALIIATVWALLPIHVSTVLYVVQRMVLLSTFFMLAGIICYVVSRNLLEQGKNSLSLIFFAHTLLFAFLAILSKESGLLIFAYLLCVEQIINIKKPIKNLNYKWGIRVCLLTPLVLFLIYLIHLKFYNGYLIRPFSLEERLLTETRVLWVYISQIILPKPSDLGLYHDSFRVSHGLLDPVSTVISCIAWLFVLIGVMWCLIKQKVHIFFPCLWFLSGHLMESTVIPLEIYFEHRNYLASLGIVLLIFFVVFNLFERVHGVVVKYIFVGIMLTYLGVIMIVLQMQTRLWGDSMLFNYVHATERPSSIRARALIIDFYQKQGKPQEAYKALEDIERDFPDEPALYFLKLQFLCAYPSWVKSLGVDGYTALLQYGAFSNGTFKSIEDLVDFKSDKQCEPVSYELLLKSISILKLNKQYAHKYYFLARFETLLYLQMGDLNSAIRALESIPNRGYDDAVSYARLLASAGNFDTALTAVNAARKVIGNGITVQHRRDELNELESVILNDIRASK